MKSNLRSNTQKYIDLTDDEFEYYASLFELKTFHKKEFLLKQGDVCQFEAYVVAGTVVGYHENENGNKIVTDFMFDDWWVTDICGLAVQRPSVLNFQALERTRVLYITREQKLKLYEKYPVFNKLYRLMGMVRIGAMQRRTIANLSLTGEEKYFNLVQKYPFIEDKIPQYLLASYLGISAEFLSKIKRKIRQEA